ncbi:MAG: hypothetical protein AABW73_02350 [Nanoarchaeota archaeon]|mgnify:CR=1 FL=1
MKYLLITDIKTKLSDAQVMMIAEVRTKKLIKVEGLTKKSFVYDRNNSIYHEIYEFDSEESLRSYVKTNFANNVAEEYKTTEPVKIRIMRVLKEQKNDK